MRLLSLFLFAAATASAHAQFEMQESHTTASLRGIHAVGKGIAWASGTNGTVLRTEDGGYVWQGCAVPPRAEKLDFRGIQGFDANTAIVMSSGPGDLSRVYKTTDGCSTWKLVFTNPDKDGFFDAIVAENHFTEGTVIGDQVNGKFALFGSLYTLDRGWDRVTHTVRSPSLDITAPRAKNEVMFAASNSILSGGVAGGLAFVTGGKDGSFLHATKWHRNPIVRDWWRTTFETVPIPMVQSASAGAFSLAARTGCPGISSCALVVVGGDYLKPNDRTGTAAYGAISHQSEVPERFHRADTMPMGYRSAVAYDSGSNSWVAVGPNGTDTSHDDGKNWEQMRPGAMDETDADKNWNALSLPFVVGPKGRIGKLRPEALGASPKK